MGETTHHAEYVLPGLLFPEETTRQLDARDPAEAAEKAPEGAFAFVLYDLPVVPDTGLDPEQFRVTPKRQNVSKRYYLGGTLHSLDEVRAMGDDKRTLVANMEGNGWATVICTPFGNWQPFEDGDTLLEPVSSGGGS